MSMCFQSATDTCFDNKKLHQNIPSKALTTTQIDYIKDILEKPNPDYLKKPLKRLIKRTYLSNQHFIKQHAK